jgi:phosphatidylglycerophosphate synthase
MSDYRRITFETFWQMRAKQGFLMLHYFSYPLGSCAAWVCWHLRLSPNQVTVLSAIAACGTPAYVIIGNLGALTGGLILLFGLHLAQVLDCADGVLARATKRGSAFGAIFDKVLDACNTVLIPGFLCVGSLGQSSSWIAQGWQPYVLLLIIVSRVALAVTIWLKDFVVTGGDHLVADERNRNLSWLARRFVGSSIDTPVYYTLIALSWATGYFWEFMAAYGLWNLVVWLGYLALARKDLGKRPG